MKKSFPLLIAGCLIFVSLFGAAACSKDEDADLKKDAHKISASAEDNICEHCGKKLYEGEIEYTLSDNQKYYIAEISRADGDVIVPGYYKDLGEEDYLPVLEVADLQGPSPLPLSKIFPRDTRASPAARPIAPCAPR